MNRTSFIKQCLKNIPEQHHQTLLSISMLDILNFGRLPRSAFKDICFDLSHGYIMSIGYTALGIEIFPKQYGIEYINE
mgnify:CR=1 FL=1